MTDQSKKNQNEGLVNSISALINTRLKEFKSKMINMINKNVDQPMSLGDRGSYYESFETNNVSKREKDKTGDTHFYDLPTLFKNCTENNDNNGLVVVQKRPITNSDGGNNTPAKVSCFQNPAKKVSDVW